MSEYSYCTVIRQPDSVQRPSPFVVWSRPALSIWKRDRRLSKIRGKSLYTGSSCSTCHLEHGDLRHPAHAEKQEPSALTIILVKERLHSVRYWHRVALTLSNNYC